MASAPVLAEAMREAIAIWQRVWPGDTLDFAFWRGEDPRWSHPSVQDGPRVFGPDHLNAAFLGRQRRVPRSGTGQRRSIWLSIPREPTPAELAAPELPAAGAAGAAARLLRFSPLAAEVRRHGALAAAFDSLPARHRHAPLINGLGGQILPPLDPVPADQGLRPAVLIGMHWLETGGAEELAFQSIDLALAAGLRVFVVAERPGLHRLATRLPRHPDVVFLRPDRWLPHELWPLWLENLVRAENIRLIHIHHCVPLYAALAHLRLSCPWLKVMDSTHILEAEDGGFPRISGVWTQYIDWHHVISQQLADWYRDSFGVTERVLTGRMLPPPGSPVLPLRIAPGQRHVTLAFVGRLVAQKRPLLLVPMLRALHRWGGRQGVTLRLRIAGDGPLAGALDAALARHGLTGLVERVGGGADVAALLRGSDILLLPSENEGLALVTHEALAAGCLPLACDVGAQSELLPGALLLPSEPRAAIKALVERLERILHDAHALEGIAAELAARAGALQAGPRAAQVLGSVYAGIARG